MKPGPAAVTSVIPLGRLVVNEFTISSANPFACRPASFAVTKAIFEDQSP